MGIDPGLAIVGYSFIEKNGNKFTVHDYGVIRTTAGKPVVKRLSMIYKKLFQLIEEYKPEEMAVEKLYFNKNVKTAINVGQARGVILLAGAESKLKISEYTPLQVKQAVVGYGRAGKKQVQQMVKALLNLNEIPRPDDAADALAVAICHGNSLEINNQLSTYQGG